jgi:hypothetical protein
MTKRNNQWSGPSLRVPNEKDLPAKAPLMQPEGGAVPQWPNRKGRRRVYPLGYTTNSRTVNVRLDAAIALDEIKLRVLSTLGRNVPRMVVIDLLLEHWTASPPSLEKVSEFLNAIYARGNLPRHGDRQHASASPESEGAVDQGSPRCDEVTPSDGSTQG